MANLEQERALSAYAVVDSVEEDDRKEFKSAAKKLPASIQNCGLLQTFAFYQKEQKRVVRDQVTSWLRERAEFGQDLENGEIVQNLAGLSREKYRMARAEAIEYATWLKRATDSWTE